ncbi:hypothetical protein NX059_001254 [Plenodomus lindquistii]|nr:hypothetical protein NX059_001254 [Plenodomus lindquistii]
MPRINDLPEEILELILNNVKETEHPTLFWNSLRTCQKWHRVGLGLYIGLGFATTVVVESDIRRNKVEHGDGELMTHLGTRLKLEIPSKLYLSVLKSLTIQIQHRRNTSLFDLPRGTDFIGSMNDLFSHTERLTTFSLNFADGWDFPNLDVPAIPQSWLARVVDILPDSVINLELDSAGIDVPLDPDVYVDQKDHLCFQISKIFTRLQRLRLRIGHVCNTMLGDGFNGPNDNTMESWSQNTLKPYEKAVDNLLSKWHMRSLTIWLPWGTSLTLDNPFSRACTTLLDINLHNPTVILMIQQNDVYCAKRTNITTPALPVHNKFTWTPYTNVSPALRIALPSFRFATICGYTASNRRLASMNPTLPSPPHPSHLHCKECTTIRSPPTRHYLTSPTFSPPPEPDTTTSYPHIALQTIESSLSWTSNTHLSYRYPLACADEPGKPFYRGANRWACQLPGCKVKSKSMLHLRGHQIYKHVNYTSFGELRCPSVGCDWVGDVSSRDTVGFDRHVAGHHFEGCVVGGFVELGSFA